MFTTVMTVLGLIAAGIGLAVFFRSRKENISPEESVVSKVMAVEFEHLRAQNDKPVVALFYADWCSACAAQAPAFRRVARDLQDVATFVAIDTDKNKSLSTRMEVAKIPVTMVFDGNNPPIAKHNGVMEDEQLSDFVLKAVARISSSPETL